MHMTLPYGVDFKNVSHHDRMFVLKAWKPNPCFIHRQILIVVILMILLTCQAQFDNCLYADHKIN